MSFRYNWKKKIEEFFLKETILVWTRVNSIKAESFGLEFSSEDY